MICDGDSKTLSALKALQPYGPIEIKEHECVGRVQKRVTPRVEAARKLFNAEKASRKKLEAELKARMKEVRTEFGLKRGRGRGRRGRGGACVDTQGEEEEGASGGVTRGRGRGRGRGTGRKGKGKMAIQSEVERRVEGERILGELQEKLDGLETLQGLMKKDDISQLGTYFGNAIRGNVGDLEKMTDAVWATFYHSFSTDDHPRHYCCPKGEDSWCRYNRALAREEDAPPHHPIIPADLEKYLEPGFQ